MTDQVEAILTMTIYAIGLVGFLGAIYLVVCLDDAKDAASEETFKFIAQDGDSQDKQYHHIHPSHK